MKRRKSFLRIPVGFFATLGISLFQTCRAIADHFSSYSWPSYPKEGALRSHLLGKPHYFSQEKVDSLSFEEIRALHDKHHADMGGRPPHPSRLWKNKTYKKPKAPEVRPTPPKPETPKTEPPKQEPPVTEPSPSYSRREVRDITPRSVTVPQPPKFDFPRSDS